jgi:hypothetical protein
MTTENDTRRRLEKAEAEAAAARVAIDDFEALRVRREARTARAMRLGAALGKDSTVSDHGGCHAVCLGDMTFDVFDDDVRACVMEPLEKGSGLGDVTTTPASALKAEVEFLKALRAKEWVMRTKQIELAKATAKKIKDLTWP